ncbi:helix-turn-helix transcriptional regulator [Actinoplanes sp. CA-142083]|uniref:helix-turn-helix transcriptional regulator n=1 Tax=Actinoplanes sp. CA-142083 TaxID=3239903 RepID=UPI003D91ACD8
MSGEADPHAPVALRRLDLLIAGVRAGRGGAVAVTGEPGVGKSALLARLAARAPGMTVLTAAGAPGEAALPYAALGDLLRPLRDRIAQLPPPQARAVGAAFALRAGDLNPYHVCLSTLNLICVAAPALVIVDDVDLIDPPSATALFFAARRIRSDGVGMVFAARRKPEVPGVGELPLCARPEVLDGLTQRETEVVRAIAGGLSNPEAATALRLSRKTVETHLSSAYRKLGVRSRTQLVRYLAAFVALPSPREFPEAAPPGLRHIGNFRTGEKT